MLCVYLFSDQFNLKEIVLNIDLGNSPLNSELKSYKEHVYLKYQSLNMIGLYP